MSSEFRVDQFYKTAESVLHEVATKHADMIAADLPWLDSVPEAQRNMLTHAALDCIAAAIRTAVAAEHTRTRAEVFAECIEVCIRHCGSLKEPGAHDGARRVLESLKGRAPNESSNVIASLKRKLAAIAAKPHMVFVFECTRQGESPHLRQYDTREEAERFRTEQLSGGRPCGEIREIDCGQWYDEEEERAVAAETKRCVGIAEAEASRYENNAEISRKAGQHETANRVDHRAYGARFVAGAIMAPRKGDR